MAAPISSHPGLHPLLRGLFRGHKGPGVTGASFMHSLLLPSHLRQESPVGHPSEPLSAGQADHRSGLWTPGPLGLLRNTRAAPSNARGPEDPWSAQSTVLTAPIRKAEAKSTKIPSDREDAVTLLGPRSLEMCTCATSVENLRAASTKHEGTSGPGNPAPGDTADTNTYTPSLKPRHCHAHGGSAHRTPHTGHRYHTQHHG